MLAEDRQCCNGMEVCRTSILRNIEPRDRAVDVRRTAPRTRSNGESFEGFPKRRWMEMSEPPWVKVAEKEEFYRHELGYGTLTKAVTLPQRVDSGNVHTELRDGILSATLLEIRAAERHTAKVA